MSPFNKVRDLIAWELEECKSSAFGERESFHT